GLGVLYKIQIQKTAGGTDTEKKKADEAIREYETANKALLQSYVLFEKNSDSQLDDMAQRVRDIAGYSTQAAQMQKRLDQAMHTKATNGGTGAGITKSDGGKTGGYKSRLEMPDYQRSMKELAMGIPSMKELTDYAAKLKTEMGETTSTVDYNRLMAEYAEVQAAIAAQPLAISAGININQAEQLQSIEAQWAELSESLHLQMEADVKVNTAQIAAAASGMDKDAKKTQATWGAVASSVSSVGSALQNVGNKGLDIAGTVMQAVADIALGFAMAMASPKAAALGPWGWIAATAAGLATMTATIAAIKAQTSGSYALGGVVPGAYNGGMDSTFVYASPGEVILNRAQQENLLSQLDDGVGRGGVVKSITTGEQLITVINNTGRRRGRGELLFG
ncbi:MAG: hypothetical protein LUD72_03515, partial [Bacteroidales bacterium]|nr:hypothetical protein [Bacteroidales bacterium]